MDIREWTDILVSSAESNRCKYVPWWEDDFEGCMYRYDIFSQEDVQNIEKSVKECEIEQIFECVGGMKLTRFHLLVWHNFYGAVESILERAEDKALVNKTDGAGKGITPLMLACVRGNLAMAKLLTEHGADAAICDAEGRNGYHYVARPSIQELRSSFECLRRSMDQREGIARLMGDGINQKDAQGMTPLALMLHNNNSNCSWALTGVFLEKGADTDYIDENGNTLLMTAISNRHITAAFRLMECGEAANMVSPPPVGRRNMVNKENNEGKTPIQLADYFRNDALCMALKEHGAEQSVDIEASRMDMGNFSRITSNAFASCSVDERDPISAALYLAKKLIERVDPDDDDDMKCLSNILYSALLNDEKCQVLDLCRDAGIDFTEPICSGGSVTCLRDECLGGNYGVKVIKKFMEFGVDMDEAIIKGRTPANIVASLQPRNMMFGGKDTYFEEAASYFSRESMEQVDDGGTTAMHGAARNGHVDMLKVMIEKGADVNITQDAPADAGNTPLHVASIYGKSEVVKLLMESGADDSLQNLDGETPAHLAVMKKKFGGDLNVQERAAVLRELKHLDIARNDGKTPLMVLQYMNINDNIDLLPIFLEKGVDVNHRDNNGNTALILQAQNQCYKGTVKELVRAGADVNAIDKDGNTALHYALRYGDQGSARFMIKKGADYNYANNKGVTPVQIAVEKGYDNVLALMDDIQ